MFKNIHPLSIQRGIIYDWKLSFSLCYPTKAYANIHQEKGNCVHGVIMKLKRNDFKRLSIMELSYRTVKLPAYSYENPNKIITVHTFIFDKICQDRIKNEIKKLKDKQQVIRIFNPKGEKPTKNYLDTIVRGAKELKLDEKYVKRLQEVEYVPMIPFNPTKEQLNKINGKIWKMNDIKHVNKKNKSACVSIFKGIVLDMGKFPPSWKMLVKGNDITLMYARRWAYVNEFNCKSIYNLEDGQKEYINHEVQTLLNGVYDAKILGKMDQFTYEFGYDNYQW